MAKGNRNAEQERPKAEEIETIIQKVKESNLEEKDRAMVERLLKLLMELLRVIEAKNVTISRLKRWIFGPRSDERKEEEGKGKEREEEGEKREGSPKEKKKVKGHGRKGQAEYWGAKVVKCGHEELKVGGKCPGEGCGGKLYEVERPKILIQLVGQPLVGATKYEREVVRCGDCQERYVAGLPEGVKEEKYDATADVAVVIGKYGAGLPFYRMARMQEGFGVPIAESVQWERVEGVADAVLPVYVELEREAAKAKVIYQDDTKVKIVKRDHESGRKSQQTTGMVAEVEGRQIALYMSGSSHAGENVSELLKKREAGKVGPIRMGDGLAANRSPEVAGVIEACCLAHARRKFVEIEASFPRECGKVLDIIGKIYRTEAETAGKSDAERLAQHQTESQPRLEGLKSWMVQEQGQGRVEPNSSLGQAFGYMQGNWANLTRFVEVAGAPLDNNVAERVLKRVVLHRKNAYFFRNEHGADVSDILMSLIETCRLGNIPVFEYLVAVVRAGRAVRASPRDWLPWVWHERTRPAAA